MPALGDWVIAQVLKDISRWPGLQVAINLSPVQLKADGFVRRVIRMVAAAHVTPSQIIFEVTENVMMDATGHAGQALKDLREHGFRIALDDFGTGYSSLSYLRRSEEHTSELQSLMRISYAVFCLKKKNHKHLYTHQQQLKQ